MWSVANQVPSQTSRKSRHIGASLSLPFFQSRGPLWCNQSEMLVTIYAAHRTNGLHQLQCVLIRSTHRVGLQVASGA